LAHAAAAAAAAAALAYDTCSGSGLWIVSVDKSEGIIGGHIWIGTSCILGAFGIFIQLHGLGHVVLLFGLVKLDAS